MQDRQVQPVPTQVLITIHLARHWDIFHRRHLILALAEALPAGWAVLAVNRPLTVEVTPLKYPGRLRRELFHRAPRKLSRGLYLYTPILPLHERTAHHVPGATQLNTRLLGRQLRGLIDQWFPNARNIVSWIYHPNQHWTWQVLPGARRVYECYDEYGFWPDGRPRPELQQKEIPVLTESELTFVAAEVLARRRKTLAERIVHLPNGVPAWFVRNDTDKKPRPSGRPRIGYLGNLRAEIDDGLLADLVEQNPQWQYIFIGPVRKSAATTRLKRMPQVLMAGLLPYDRLPEYLGQFDIGLVPFRLNEFTEPMNPLKIYEYMARGIPVVASDLPELQRFAGVIRLVDNTPEAFAKAITATLEDDRDMLREKLVATAREYTWEAISRRIILPELQRLVGKTA
jgi:glycosyltransferase involved in cell wall biosynthesis